MGTHPGRGHKKEIKRTLKGNVRSVQEKERTPKGPKKDVKRTKGPQKDVKRTLKGDSRSNIGTTRGAAAEGRRPPCGRGRRPRPMLLRESPFRVLLTSFWGPFVLLTSFWGPFGVLSFSFTLRTFPFRVLLTSF